MTDTKKNPWLVFAVISLNVFMATLDGSAVNLVLPAISKQFQAALTRVEWVSTIYLLIISVSLLPSGAVASKLGQRKLYQIGIIVFTLASVLCVIATSLQQLILARALQGLGAALTSALGAGFIAHAFPDSKRGMALGMIGTVVAAGSMTGPIFGGVVAAHFGWPSIFWINLPIGLLALLLSGFWLEKDRKENLKNTPFDHLGAAISGVGLFLFLLTLSESAHSGKTLFILGLVGTIVLFALFLHREHKTEHPMLPLSIFKNRIFSSSSVFGVINTAASIQALLTLPFFFAEVKQFDMRTTGFYMSIWPLALAVFAPIAGRVADRFGSHGPSLIGPCLQSIGLTMMAFIHMDSPNSYLITAIAITGIGGSFFVPANNKSLLQSAPPKFLFLASSIMSLIRNVGMVTGIALAAAIVQFFRQNQANPASPEAFLYGMHWSMGLAAVLALISGIGAFYFGKPVTSVKSK